MSENKHLEEQLWNIAESFRGNMNANAFRDLIIRLLAWGVLSKRGQLPNGVMSAEDVLATQNLAVALAEVWESFGQQENKRYHAFSWDTEKIDHSKMPMASLLKLVIDAIEKNRVDALVETTLKNTDKKSGPMTIASSLSAFLTLLLKKCEVKELYTPFTHSANLVKNAMQSVEQVYIENMHYETCKLYTLLSFIYNTETEVQTANALYDPQYKKSAIELRKFENTLAIPPFGTKRSRDDIERMKNASTDVFNRFQGEHNLRGEAPYFLHIATQTSKKAFVMTTNGTLFRQNEASLRKEWVNSGCLEAIVQLPSKLFSHTALQTVLLVFDYEKTESEGVYFADASLDKFVEQQRSHNALVDVETLADRIFSQQEVPHEALKVSVESIKSQGYDLQPQTYILSKEEEKMMKTIESGKFVDLGDTVEIISTRSLKDAEKGQVFAEIRSSAIPEAGFIVLGDLDDDDLKSRSLDESNAKVAEKQTLAAYDVLLSVKGRVGQVGIMPGDIDSTYIAGQSYSILRSNDEAQAIGLYLFLQSDFGQQQLQRLTSDSAITQITTKTLKELQVPAFDAEQLKKAKAQFEEEVRILSEIKTLKKRMYGLRSNFMDSM